MPGVFIDNVSRGRENNLSIHLESKDLINSQQIEVAVNGPDGATHLILCTGMTDLSCSGHETYTFLVGPQLSRRQFVGAIASGAISTIQYTKPMVSTADLKLKVGIVLMAAYFDDESGQVKVIAEVSSRIPTIKLAINYNVSILAEMLSY